MNKKRPAQPNAKDLDLREYENLNLIIDYGYQLDYVLSTEPKSVLEVGKGMGGFEALLKRYPLKVTTVDIDESFNPDVVADITELPFKNKSFDTVCAFEVLEHMPYEESLQALKEMKRVAKNYVVISLPYACLYFGVGIQFSYLTALKPIFNFFSLKPFHPAYVNLALPLFFLNTQGMTQAHAWEMGRKGYSKKKVKRDLTDLGFKIEVEGDRIFYPYHYFFSLKIG